MVYCSECGAALNEGAKFCSECGTAVVASGDSVSTKPDSPTETSIVPESTPATITPTQPPQDNVDDDARATVEVSEPPVPLSTPTKGKKVVLVVAGIIVAIVAVIGVVAITGSSGDESSQAPVAQTDDSTPVAAQSDIVGWWVESEPVEGKRWSPSYFNVESSNDGGFAVVYQFGVVLGIETDPEAFTMVPAGDGLYETDGTTTSDYTLEVTSPGVVNLTDNSSDDATPTEFVLATADEAQAAITAGEEAVDGGDSSGGGSSLSGGGSGSGSGLSSGEYKAKCRTVKFNVLKKDADSLASRKYTFKGQVFQIQDAGNGSYWTEFEDAGFDVQPQTQVLLSVTQDEWGYWDDQVMVLYDGKMKKVYEDNIVQVWGECSAATPMNQSRATTSQCQSSRGSTTTRSKWSEFKVEVQHPVCRHSPRQHQPRDQHRRLLLHSRNGVRVGVERVPRRERHAERASIKVGRE